MPCPWKKHIIKLILFIVIGLTSPWTHMAQAGAASRLKIGTFAIPLMVTDSETGVFVDLTREILDRTGLEADIVVMPPKRTLLYFSTKDIDIVFPALDVFFATGTRYTKPDEIFYQKEDFVFTRKGEELLRIVPELEGKYVGITTGYAYAPELLDNRFIHIERAATDEQNAHKLITGRMDAFVVEKFSGLRAFKNTGLAGKVQYDPDVPLSRQDVFFAFQDDGTGKALATRFSEALRSMKDDGTFSSIMEQAAPDRLAN